MFVAKIILLVDDGVLQSNNIENVRRYLEQEAEINKKISHSFFNRTPEKYPTLYDDARKLTNDNITDEQIDLSVNKIYRINNSINPTLEIIELMKNLSICTPQHCAIIQITYNGVVLGSISVTVDFRLTLFGGCVAYMVGIRKSTVLFAVQQLSSSSDLANFKLSGALVPEVIKYSLERKAEYVVVTPIGKMINILEKYHGFKCEPKNIMNVGYSPPCFLMECEEEPIHWKKITE